MRKKPPEQQEKAHRQQMSTRIPVALHTRLRHFAVDHNLTSGDVIEQALSMYFTRHTCLVDPADDLCYGSLEQAESLTPLEQLGLRYGS